VELLNQSKGDERIRGTSLLCKSRIPLHRLELKTHYEVKGFSFFLEKNALFGQKWDRQDVLMCEGWLPVLQGR